jgi:23S rRNA (guanine2445-N2)-methyltransferase / 23S rRNA (guanine2069-N7)-methyltransferase
MKQSEMYSIFVTCPKGLHYALERELDKLGASIIKATPSGVEIEADKVCIYRILLWSRIANRVIFQLAKGKVDSAEDLYDITSSVNWDTHFSSDKTFAVDFLGTNEVINNSTFGALKVKDAVVDQFRDKTGVRPNVSKTEPEIRISARLHKDRLSLGLDLSGESLHKRGYRTATGRAPLKENLGAGLLALAGWPDQYAEDASFLDPMCGSGTLLIEAAMIACNKAPGLDREVWGFDAWHQHDSEAWLEVKALAQNDFLEGKSAYRGRIVGFDQDSQVVSRAWDNIRQAGFEDLIHVEKQALADLVLFEKMQHGLVLCNPPYGERLGEVKELESLYALFGQQFEQHLIGWDAGIFTGNVDLGRKVAWRSHKQYKLYNGAIESQLLLFKLAEENRFKEAWQAPALKIHDPGYWKISNPARAEMFNNRLKKNLRTVGKWAKKQKISCYRLYDADMPEFAVAIDIYLDESKVLWLHVQEYTAPKSIDEATSLERLREALAVLPDCLSVEPSNIFLKRRAIQKGVTQYEKNDSLAQYLKIQENDMHLLVNLTDYLDTGIFLDHRPIRRWVHENLAGKRFLNLFCYTATVTVNAAMGGAKESLSLDMSRTYLSWAKENFSANNIDLSKHKLSQQDCIEWLNKQPVTTLYDVIFLDPPSFSNSKRMEGVLDIQRDHVSLINGAMKHLGDDGQLVFSNNLRKFKIDEEELSTKYILENITSKTIAKDFERNQKIHQCWLVKRR